MEDLEPARAVVYQPALDGLRGVAVAAVVLFHGNVRIAGSGGRGGFLGVDIFFVLSGYLITSLLLVEFARSGRIARASFWSRRARRLLPAFAVTLVLVALYAAFEPATGRAGLRSDAIFSILYVQNWHSIWSHGATEPSPLNHLWSLSVEEQWYLVWPVVLAVLLRFTRMNRRVVLAAVAVFAVASAIWTAVLFTPIDTTRAYFGTDTRAQELLVGAALAVLLLNRPVVRSRFVRNAIEVSAWVAAAYVVREILFAWTTDPFLYHGGFLLIALATAVVIAAVTSPAGLLRRALSTRPLVALGLISYGVYLYHRPIFAFVTAGRSGLHGVALFAAHVVIAVAFATASYRLLERPIRERRLQLTRGSAFGAATVTLASVTLLVVLPGPTTASPARIAPQTIAYLTQRRLRAPPGATRVLVAGETTAFALQAHAGDSFDGDGISSLSFGLLGCGIAAGDIVVQSTLVVRGSGCDTWPETFDAVVAAYQPAVVVLLFGDQEIFDRVVGTDVQRVGTRSWISSLSGQLDRARRILSARGARVLVATVPCPPTSTAVSVFGPAVRDPRRLAAVNSVLRRYAATNRLQLVDLAAFACPGGEPLRSRNGHVVSDSTTGLSVYGATLIWQWLAPQISRAP